MTKRWGRTARETPHRQRYSVRESLTPQNGGVAELGSSLDSTDELVEAMKIGDPRVGQALYTRYADRLYDLALACTHEYDVAAAIVADIIVESSQAHCLAKHVRLDIRMYASLREHIKSWIGSRIAPDDRVIELDHDVDVTDPIQRGHLMFKALAGASERDQLMVNLALRHNIANGDLAQVMGISQASCDVLWETTSTTLCNQFSALLALAWLRTHMEHPIPELAPLFDLAVSWDGNYTPLVHRQAAKRLQDHPEAKDWILKNLDDPLNALSAVPLTPAPVGLQVVVHERLEMAHSMRNSTGEQTPVISEPEYDTDDSTIPPGAWPGDPINPPANTVPKRRRKTRISRTTIATLAGIVGISIGSLGTLSIQRLYSPTRIMDATEATQTSEASVTTTGAPTSEAKSLPGRLTVPAGVLPVESGSSTSMLLANTGGTVLEWRITNLPEWVETNPEQGTLAPGTTVEVALSLGKVSDSAEQTGQIDIAWDGIESGTSSVQVQSHAGLPPKVGDIAIAQQPPKCNELLDLSLQVQDSAGVRDVVVNGLTENGNSYSQALTHSEQEHLWKGSFGPIAEAGPIRMSVIATDALGNTIEANRGTVTINPCS